MLQQILVGSYSIGSIGAYWVLTSMDDRRRAAKIQPEIVVSGGAAPNIGSSNGCSWHTKAFVNCLNQSGATLNTCKSYKDMLKECEKNHSFML